MCVARGHHGEECPLGMDMVCPLGGARGHTAKACGSGRTYMEKKNQERCIGRSHGGGVIVGKQKLDSEEMAHVARAAGSLGELMKIVWRKLKGGLNPERTMGIFRNAWSEYEGHASEADIETFNIYLGELAELS